MSNVEMKDSEINWVGFIPQDWSIQRLEKIFSKKPKKTGNLSLPTISLSFGKVVLKKAEILEETHAAYQEVKPNNILINPLNLNFDLKSLRIGVSKIHGCASSGYIVLNSKKGAHDYLNYLLHIFDILEMKNMGGGVRQTVSFENLKKVNLIFPNITQQTAIANYLDHHTTKLDKEISLLEQKVEKLDEYKQSLIYETVTKGLDKNVPMKDSEIEWIGMIPEHWEVKRVSNFFKSPKTITQPGRKDVLSLTLNGVIEKDIESNKGLSPESYDTYQIFKNNDLVFKLIDLANYNTSRVGRVWKDGIMSSAYVRLSKNKNTNIDYFYYQFFDLYKRAIFNMLGGNGVRSAINRGDLLNLSIVNPHKYEQQQIANYLDEQCSKIDKKKKIINKKVELLKEYKQSLIYEAVTGKIKIDNIYLDGDSLLNANFILDIKNYVSNTNTNKEELEISTLEELEKIKKQLTERKNENKN